MKILQIIFILLILAGCGKGNSTNEAIINSPIPIIKNSENVTSTPATTDIPKQLSFQDVLNTPTSERETIIKGFNYPSTSHIPLGAIDEYTIAFLKVLFDPNVPFSNQFKERSIIDIDDQLLNIDALSFEERSKMYFLIIHLNQSTILDSTSDLIVDSIAVYLHGDSLYLGLYKDKKFMKGFSVEKNYYVELLKKTLDLTFYIQVTGSE